MFTSSILTELFVAVEKIVKLEVHAGLHSRGVLPALHVPVLHAVHHAVLHFEHDLH